MKSLVFSIASLLAVSAADAATTTVSHPLDLQKTFGTELVPDKSQIDVKWHYLGKTIVGKSGPNAELIDQHILADDRGTAAKKQTREHFWMAVNLENGDEYLVEMPKETSQNLRSLSQKAGWDLGFDAGKGEPSIDDANKGWSDGADTRTRRTNNTAYPFSAMGQMNGGLESGCSGTMVGRRHLLTAAHCLYNRTNESWSLTMRFRPGREGTCNNIACEPYGEHAGTWFFTPVQWRTEGGYEYDYGMVVLQGTPGYDTSWLGYVALSQSTLRDYCDDNGNCYNRGYPACGFPEAPLECRLNNNFQGWAYQDTQSCEIGSFYTTGDDGWDARFSTNCDYSRGHSGSAIFTDVYNGSTKVVLGIVSTHSCTTCTNGEDYPNGIRRITPEVLDMISYFKAEMP